MDNQGQAEVEGGVDTRFTREVKTIRAEYEERRDKTNLCNCLDMTYERQHGEKLAVVYWLDDGTSQGQTVRLFDIAGTLSGNILRLRANLPPRSGHYEIVGDEIRPLDAGLPLPEEEEEEDDSEDTSELVHNLPLIDVDTKLHFTKKPKYRSEIINLLKCQRGSCPGTPISKHIIQLLGRSAKEELVFEKLSPRYAVLKRFSDLATHKRWLLNLVDALEALHAAGIVHRDLRVDNLLFTRGGEPRLVVADLEERWGQRGAPELARDGPHDQVGWSAMSDVYQVAQCIRCMVLGDVPRTGEYEVPIPRPLDAIAEACRRAEPELRPTVPQLRRMVEAIDPIADAE